MVIWHFYRDKDSMVLDDREGGDSYPVPYPNGTDGEMVGFMDGDTPVLVIERHAYPLVERGGGWYLADGGLVNATPHTLNLFALPFTENGVETKNSVDLRSNPSCLARIQINQVHEAIHELGAGDSIPIMRTGSQPDRASLPPIVYGVHYIVSRMVAEAFPDRLDFLVVNDTVRSKGYSEQDRATVLHWLKSNIFGNAYDTLVKHLNEANNIVGCRSLASLNPQYSKGAVGEFWMGNAWWDEVRR